MDGIQYSLVFCKNKKNARRFYRDVLKTVSINPVTRINATGEYVLYLWLCNLDHWVNEHRYNGKKEKKTERGRERGAITVHNVTNLVKALAGVDNHLT